MIACLRLASHLPRPVSSAGCALLFVWGDLRVVSSYEVGATTRRSRSGARNARLPCAVAHVTADPAPRSPCASSCCAASARSLVRCVCSFCLSCRRPVRRRAAARSASARVPTSPCSSAQSSARSPSARSATSAPLGRPTPRTPTPRTPALLRRARHTWWGCVPCVRRASRCVRVGAMARARVRAENLLLAVRVSAMRPATRLRAASA